MPEGREQKSKATPTTGRPLLSPEATGGLAAIGGFDFQDRYAVCHLPTWLRRDFQQMLFEGTGDIDLRFGKGETESRVHIQVKDHEIGPAELAASVTKFVQTDADMPEVYEHFILACPSLSATLRSLETGLARFRNASPFYDNIPEALNSTRDEVVNRIRQAGLGTYVEFVLKKVYFDLGHNDLKHDERAVDLFTSRLLRHPDYAAKLHEMVRPAFAALATAVSSNRGKVLDRDAVEGILRNAIRPSAVDRSTVTIWFHNWTREQFEIPADYVIDWSEHFDRETRRVPSSRVWNESLVPELLQLRKNVAAERSERAIRFRGKCALSSGWAIGLAFPAVGGWTFEIPQPPSGEIWNSHDSPTSSCFPRVELIDGDTASADLIVVLSVKGDPLQEVLDYAVSAEIRPRLTVVIEPPAQGAQAIGSGSEAVAYALFARDTVGKAIKMHGIARTHIFYYGPLALAVFLGQHFTAVGDLSLYEYTSPGYVPAHTTST